MLIDKEGENRVSVKDVLLELRNYRMGLIQTHDQLTFSYEAIIEGMKRMNNDVSYARAPSLSLTDPTLSFQTFNELDNLEIATASENEEENSPPPLPPRTSSCVVQDRPLPISPPDSSRQLEQISEPSDPTSSDVSDIIDDTDDSSDSDSDDDEDVKTLKNGRDFDANSCLPPVPNGTLDLTIPSDKQRFSSDDER